MIKSVSFIRPKKGKSKEQRMNVSKRIPYGQPNCHRCSSFQSLHTYSAPQINLHKNPAKQHKKQ